MTKRKTQKRALLASCLSILLCIVMLIGSTFAWFTDNATTSVNTIQSGTLNIDIQDNQGNSLDGKTLSFVDTDGNILTNILWEPGCTYILQEAKLVNLGNLALKYKVNICGVSGDIELANVIDVLINGQTAGTLAEMMADPDGAAYGQLMPKGEANDSASIGTIALHMQETAGNQYQNKTLTGVAITVNATQATVETDSNTDQYDTNAEYDDAYNGYAFVTVHNQDELETALTNIAVNAPTVVMLAGDTATYKFPTWTEYSGSLKDKTIVFKADGDKTFDATFFNVNGTQNLVGADLTLDGVNIDFPATSYISNGYTGLNLAGGKLTIKNSTVTGAQYLYVPTAEFINCTFVTTTDSYSIATYGAQNVTFTDCTFNTAGKAVLMYHDGNVTTNATLTNCVFNSDKSAASDKAAVETGDSGSKGSNFSITFTNCSANGFVANNSTSNLWGNKVNSNMPTDRLNVIIDGVDVY